MGVPVTGALPLSGTVQLDGFWSQSGIVASRIVETDGNSAQISGIYDGLGLVGRVPVEGILLTGFAAGQTLTVSGQFKDGKVMADTVMAGPFMDASPDLVLLEGYFHPMKASDSLSLQGVAIASASSERDVDQYQLVRRCSLNGRIDFEMSALTQSDADMVNSFCVSASNVSP